MMEVEQEDAFQSTLASYHDLNAQQSLLLQQLVYNNLSQPPPPLHYAAAPPVLRVPVPALQQTLLLSSTTGTLIGVEPLAVNSQQLVQQQQHHITHNLIPQHLQASSSPLSLNGTPGFLPALISGAGNHLMQGVAAPPAIPVEAVLQAMLAQTQQPLAIPPIPLPPATGLTVQDRVPPTPPIYNGVNPLFPGLRQVHGNPPMYVVEKFLTPCECDCLIQAAHDGWSPAPVVGKGAGEISPSRTSSTYYLAREDFPQYMRKISELTGKPVQHFELPQVGRYLPTQQYRHHFDAFDLSQEDGRRFAANGGQRVVTVLTYLNDCTQGGQTEFPSLNLRVTPKRGMALVFFPATVDGYLDKAALHAALPAVDEKYVSQVWIRQGDYHHVSSPSSPLYNSGTQQLSAGPLQQNATSDTHSAIHIQEEEDNMSLSPREKRKRPEQNGLPTSMSLYTLAFLCLFLMVSCNSSTVAALSMNQNNNRPRGGRRTASSNSRWVQRRKAGVKVARRKKPPQWEREGDDLYTSARNNPQSLQALSQDLTVEEALEMLSPFEASQERQRSEETVLSTEEVDEIASTEQPFMWGSLSVGPVWKSRLQQAGYPSPTPIQAESFKAILSKHRPNVVIASPTGSGKTLAFLLPFLSTLNMAKDTSASKKAKPVAAGSVWIATPTLELSCQIQRTAESLLNASGSESNVIHVLQSSQNTNDGEAFPLLSQFSRRQESESDLNPPPILAGTPKMFLQLQKEIKLATTKRFKGNDHDNFHVEAAIQSCANILRVNPSAIILDEADRLLQTSGSSNSAPRSPRHRPERTIPAARKLLETLAPSSPQVVCASATVGRSLRRQLMEVLQVPNMDKAATLITADLRTKKSADNRKAALLPPNLQHGYHMIRKKDDSPKDSSSILLEGLVETFDLLDAMPSIVFPGPAGVQSTMEHLSSQGFQDIRGLDSLRQSNDRLETRSVGGWKTTPIYVIKERLGRGLDLPEVRYVFVLGAPSNAASYTHIAGRTARSQEVGTAVTILEPKDAPKLVALAEMLGLRFIKC